MGYLDKVNPRAVGGTISTEVKSGFTFAVKRIRVLSDDNG